MTKTLDLIRACDVQEIPAIAQALGHIFFRVAGDTERPAKRRANSLVDWVPDLPDLIKFADHVKMPSSERPYFYICSFSVDSADMRKLYSRRKLRGGDFLWALLTISEYGHREGESGHSALWEDLDDEFGVRTKTSEGKIARGEDLVRLAAAFKNNGLDPETEYHRILSRSAGKQSENQDVKARLEQLEAAYEARDEQIKAMHKQVDEVRQKRNAYEALAARIDSEYAKQPAKR